MAEFMPAAGSIARISENIIILKSLGGQNLTPLPSSALWNFPIFLWVVIFRFYKYKRRYICTIIHPLLVPQILQIYISEMAKHSKFLFTISIHYYQGDLYKYHKSHKNEEITLYCPG